MKKINQWKQEEENVKIVGWDFSYLKGRYQEFDEQLPWDYRDLIMKYLKPTNRLLDLDTGGGEFLMNLHHPYELTSATEGYPPNVELCKEVLVPKGIDFKEVKEMSDLPFPNNYFDIVINRHGDFEVDEVYRVLKPNGIFITQQVGMYNDKDLSDLLLPNTIRPYEGYILNEVKRKFIDKGTKVIYSEEAYPPIEFYDVGALIWFAKIIEWEFINFSVEQCYDALCKVESIIQRDGKIQGTTHKFILVVQK